jgi:cytidine deaminase
MLVVVALDPRQRRELMEAATSAAMRAYAPYSGFRVGAAVQGARIHLGANVENASYGLTLCAERAAIAAAIIDGDRELRGLAIATPDKATGADFRESLPCGACRQWLAELAPEIELIVSTDGVSFTVADLLPDAFLLTPTRN